MAVLVHRMGGCIRKDFSASVTHLVSARTNGEKYRVSRTYSISSLPSAFDELLCGLLRITLAGLFFISLR